MGPQSPHTSPTSVSMSRTALRSEVKGRGSTVSLKRDSNPSVVPPHLGSAVNQQKSSVPIKQQLPMKLAKLVTAGSAGSSSSTSSSSMSSSLSGSFGGSMSPSSQESGKELIPRGAYSVGGPLTSPPSTVQQILPLKLSEGPSDNKGGSGRFGTSYHRLTSPNPTSEDAPAHQRTGSSPASLQNGAASLSTVPTGAGSFGSAMTGGGKATRTHTYPKLPSRPPPGGPERMPHQELPHAATSMRIPGAQQHTGQPGQRVKDPDSDQDIIFF